MQIVFIAITIIIFIILVLIIIMMLLLIIIIITTISRLIKRSPIYSTVVSKLSYNTANSAIVLSVRYAIVRSVVCESGSLGFWVSGCDQLCLSQLRGIGSYPLCRVVWCSIGSCPCDGVRDGAHDLEAPCAGARIRGRFAAGSGAVSATPSKTKGSQISGSLFCPDLYRPLQPHSTHFSRALRSFLGPRVACTWRALCRGMAGRSLEGSQFLKMRVMRV